VTLEDETSGMNLPVHPGLPMGRSDTKDGRQLIEEVAAGIAHEVRNPLNALQINLQILDQELRVLVPDRGSHVYSVLAKISRELGNLDNFVSEFLRYARPPRLKIEPVVARQLLADLVTFLESLTDEALLRDARLADPWPAERRSSYRIGRSELMASFQSRSIRRSSPPTSRQSR